MKFAMPFNYNNYNQSDVDQIILKWDNTEKQLENLPKFLQQNIEQHDITLAVPSKDSFTSVELTLMSELCQKYDNFKVRFDALTQEELQIIYQNNIRFFLNKYCGCLDEYAAVRQMGVSDVYVSGELAFNMEKVSLGLLHKNEEGYYRSPVIRVVPNLVQTAEGLPDYKGFFIRPEDIEYYSNYVDVFELYIHKDDNLTPAALLRAYKQEQTWFGDLSELILGLDTPIDNKRLSDDWGKIRSRCCKRCELYSNCNCCGLLIDQTSLISQYKEDDQERGGE